MFLLRCDVDGIVIDSSTCDPQTIVGIICGQCMHAVIIIILTLYSDCIHTITIITIVL